MIAFYFAVIHLSVFTEAYLGIVELLFSVTSSIMVATKQNFYYPFVNKSLGFLTNSKSGTHSEEFFTNVDLSWQPVQDPKLGIPLLVVNVLILLAGGFVHCHLWKMLKRGESLVSFILKAYVIVQMLWFPHHIIFVAANHFIYPLSEVIGSWYCVLAFFVIYPGVILSLIHI